jgi:hypothetical protein
MKQTLTVEDVLKNPLNTLSEKQIRNKLRELKTIYPKLVKGGNGYGRGFKYSFNNSLFDLVTERKYKTKTPEYKETRRDKTIKESETKRKELIFFNTEWKYFMGLTPSKNIEPSILKETIKDPNLNIFYSIHRNYDTNSSDIDTNHIHWIFDIKNNQFNLHDYIKKLNNTLFLSIPSYPQTFNHSKKQECYDYFIGKWYKNNRKQNLIEYETL